MWYVCHTYMSWTQIGLVRGKGLEEKGEEEGTIQTKTMDCMYQSGVMKPIVLCDN